uniref:Uncharacterized protein n=1 Tax=Anguilla anguilla TaxID=7936 RepID=A0A0E9X9G1_ANGAN
MKIPQKSFHRINVAISPLMCDYRVQLRQLQCFIIIFFHTVVAKNILHRTSLSMKFIHG